MPSWLRNAWKGGVLLEFEVASSVEGHVLRLPSNLMEVSGMEVSVCLNDIGDQTVNLGHDSEVDSDKSIPADL